MKRLHKFMAASLLLLTASMAQAQYKGPGASSQLLTVKEIISQASKLDRSDTLVKIQGFVIQQISGDTFWFQDASGKIKVEIEKKQMPAVPFDDKTELIIIGEVDHDLLEGTEIEAKQVEIKAP